MRNTQHPRARHRLSLGLVLAASVVSVSAALGAPSSSTAQRVLTLVALGDSTAYGADCSGCTGYVSLFARRAATVLGAPIRIENRAAHDNLTSARLLDEVRRNAKLRT